MNHDRTKAMFCAAAWLLVLLIHGTARADPVEGIVLDEGGAPIQGVTVSLWAVGKPAPVDSTSTDMSGRYLFKGINMQVFDIAYTHTKMEPSVVTYLAGTKTQNISKVMYLKDGKNAPSGISARLDALDRYVYLLASVKQADRRAFQSNMKNMGFVVEFKSSYFGTEDLEAYFSAKARFLDTIYEKLVP